MIYLELLWAFLKVGTFSFGGAYGSIPLIRDVVMSHGWLSDEMFSYFVAVSESTPGPIMINMATYVGAGQAGFWGAALATLGVTLPSFFIILAIVAPMKNFIKNQYVQAALRGIKPCFIGIVLAMGTYMIFSNAVLSAQTFSADWRAVAITIILLGLSFGYKRFRRKGFSPILLIILSAGMGIVTYALPF